MKKGESHQRALRPQRRAPDLGGPPGLHRLVDRRPPGRGCGRGASRRWRSPPDRRRYARPRAEWECARDRELRVGEGGRRPWRVGPLGADLRVAPSVRHRVLWCRRVRVSLLSFVLSFFRHTHRSQSSALQAARPHMHAHGDTGRLRVTHGDATATGTAVLQWIPGRPEPLLQTGVCVHREGRHSVHTSLVLYRPQTH
jgi:hypothetical protein